MSSKAPLMIVGKMPGARSHAAHTNFKPTKWPKRVTTLCGIEGKFMIGRNYMINTQVSCPDCRKVLYKISRSVQDW